MRMTEATNLGISRTTFAVGLIVAILASSLISIGAVTQTGLIKGPKGDKGDTGATGLQGPQGPSGISKIPFDMIEGYESDYTNSTEYTDIKGMSLSITTEKSSNLLIIFTANLVLQGPDGWSASGWLRAVVDNVRASPWEVPGINIDFEDAGQKRDRNTFVFSEAVVPGTHIVKIQWKVMTPDFRLVLSFIDPESSLQILALPYG